MIAPGGSSGVLQTDAGGFAGVVDSGAITDAYATGAVAGTGTSFSTVGGFAGLIEEGGAVNRVYATGLVSGPGQLAGLVGQLGSTAFADTSGTLSNSYWDTGTTGQTVGYHDSGTGAATNVVGIGAATGINPFVSATYAGWDFTNTWSTPSAGFYPELFGVSHVLRVTAGQTTAVYGTLPTVTLNLYGFQSGDDASVVSGLTGALAGTSTSSSGYYNAGIYGLSFSGGSASDASGSYRLIYVSGALTVTPKPLGAGLAGTVEKTYDATTNATLAPANYQLSGVIAGDSVSLNDPVSGTYNTKIAGSGKLVSVSGLALTGADAANYTVNGSTSASVGIIDPKAITASLTGTVERTYDGTTNAPLAAANYQLSGVIAGDSVSLNDPASGAYDTKNAGSGKLVSVSGLALTGADALNYTVNGSASASIGIIDQKALTVTLVGPVEKSYDATTNAALASANYLLSGVVAGDSVSLNDPASGAYDTKNVGASKLVSVGGLAISGPDAANYTVSASASGSVGIIDPKALTVTLIGTVEKTYDATTSAALAPANYQLSGVIGGESVSLNDPANGTYDSKNAGSGKLVSVSGLALFGPDAANYSVTVTVSGSVGIIDPKAITASLTGTVEKTYDGTTNATFGPANFQLAGVIGGDSVSVATASGSRCSKTASFRATATAALFFAFFPPRSHSRSP